MDNLIKVVGSEGRQMPFLSQYLTIFGEYAGLVEYIIYIILLLIAVYIVDRFLFSRLKSLAIRAGAPIEVVKGIQLLFRFIIVVVVIMIIAGMGLVPPEYIAGAGALIGTAIGFSLTRTVSNFVSGAYVLVSGLFKIGDYIRVGSEEGVVVDMTINYTKIRRGDGSTFIISNSEILNKSVINFKVKEGDEEFYVYSIEANVESKVEKERILRAFEEIKTTLAGKVEDISISFSGYTRLETKFMITFKVKNPNDIPALTSEIYSKLTELSVGS